MGWVLLRRESRDHDWRLGRIFCKASSRLADQRPKKSMTDIVLAIVMLAAFALVAGAIFMWRRTGEMKQPALMVLLALVAVANVLIWTLPTPEGERPLDKAQELEE